MNDWNTTQWAFVLGMFALMAIVILVNMRRGK